MKQMYEPDIKKDLDKILFKLYKRDKEQYFKVKKKIIYLQENPFHAYKFLKEPLQGYNRVHVTGSFVLIFRINHTNRTIELKHYDHWDNVYKWRPKE
ncbi:MAG TPA: addiction module toxin RelE [Candidatus Nanoarchaeia archaeon]|nr:addiction module toxin RelE [Candidatus Nanoarchaeia archaeon]